MADLKNCEYVLVEYAPSPLRETRVAVGLFLFEASGRLVRQGFAADWRQVRCLDPQADTALLENLGAHFERLAGQGNRLQGTGYREQKNERAAGTARAGCRSRRRAAC